MRALATTSTRRRRASVHSSRRGGTRTRTLMSVARHQACGVGRYRTRARWHRWRARRVLGHFELEYERPSPRAMAVPQGTTRTEQLGKHLDGRPCELGDNQDQAGHDACDCVPSGALPGRDRHCGGELASTALRGTSRSRPAAWAEAGLRPRPLPGRRLRSRPCADMPRGVLPGSGRPPSCVLCADITARSRTTSVGARDQAVFSLEHALAERDGCNACGAYCVQPVQQGR